MEKDPIDLEIEKIKEEELRQEKEMLSFKDLTHSKSNNPLTFLTEDKLVTK